MIRTACTALALALSIFSCSVLAAPAAPVDPLASIKNAPPAFAFDAMPLAHIVRLVYEQAFPERAYFLDPEILQDVRPVSFRYKPKDGAFKPYFSTFLRSLGYALDDREKHESIRKIPPAVHLSAAEDPALDVFYYRPRFRDGSYLVEMLSPLFQGKFTSQRAVHVGTSVSPTAPTASAPPQSALAQMDRKIDQLLFSGSAKEVAVLKKLLAQIDVDPGQVLVSGVLYEVQTGMHEGSAIQLAANLFGGKFSISLGSASSSDNFISFKSGTVQGIMQALNTDSRFKVLSNPSLRVGSGHSASFTVGQDVPILGALTYPQGAAVPVQSVEYRSSGVIFNIAPEIRDGMIDVRVDQQVSNFVNTTTGVNTSPTLMKRQLATRIAMADGDVVVIGGLREDRKSGAASGLSFLPDFLQTKTQDNSNSEIVLFLQVQKI